MTDISAVYKILKKEFEQHHTPVVDLIQAQTKDPFKVLVATILSARTKDSTTAEAVGRLFVAVSTPKDLLSISTEKLENLIYPVGFYKNKARFLKQLPIALQNLFGGRIPHTVEELIKLPGVGRKTANLVVAVGFNKHAICVDVHVHRITNRLGYINTRIPLETEMRLREKLPRKYWISFNSYLVSFGQNTCTPINPHCDTCPIYEHCARVDVKTRYARSA
ncbi:MAG: endonuclease III domain-containing protein [Fibrobacterota bacterium]